MQDSQKAQHFLFQEIEKRFKHHKDFLAHTAKLLNVSRSGFYKRAKCEQELVISEIAILTSTYGISLDHIIGKARGEMTFTHAYLQQQPASFEVYLLGIAQSLRQVAALPNAVIHYASVDIPLFDYAYFPDLLAFKLFSWGKNVWEIEKCMGNRINFASLLTEETQFLIREILWLFSQIPTNFYWTSTIYHNTVNQLQHFYELQIFEETDVYQRIITQLQSLLSLQQKMAEKGLKAPAQPNQTAPTAAFRLFHNEILTTSNLILVENQVQPALFLTYDTPNFLQFADKTLYDYTLKWFSSMQDKSVAISQTNQREREKFFKKIRLNIEQAGANMRD
jgi:hypothetical protein